MRKKKSLFRAHGAEFSDDHQVRLLQGAEELFPALVAAMDATVADASREGPAE